MLNHAIIEKFQSTSKNTLVSTFLVANVFVWYLTTFTFLKDVARPEDLLSIVSVNFFALVLSAIISTSFGRFKQRLVFLKYWVLAGVLLSLLFAVINLADFTILLIVAGVLGVYFGLGMPVCMGYYTANTEPQNRAKFSGIIILLMGLGYSILSSIGTAQALITASTLSIWLIIGLILLTSLRLPEKELAPKDRVSYRSIISNKTFLLYIVPWFMFSLVNDLTQKMNSNYFGSNQFPVFFGQNFFLIENILAGVSAIVCGVLADKSGRKRLALIAFALLGLGYASLTFGGYLTAWFYVCVDGIAWGVFSMLFILTIWGDIAQEKSSEKYYVLGVLPYLLSNITRTFFGTDIAAVMGGEKSVFSFAAIFLFIAILPLAYAPETLSDKIIKNIELNEYVANALKKTKKENAKNKINTPKENLEEQQKTPDTWDDDSPEAIEAKKMAKKYY